eukprot:COSAG05_NODE_145_length_16478_cov_15.287197_14_plen_52_part_00
MSIKDFKDWKSYMDEKDRNNTKNSDNKFGYYYITTGQSAANARHGPNLKVK